MHRTHLVRDRANAADSSRDVRHLGEVTPAQESFKHPWRLVNPEFHIRNAVAGHLDVNGTLTLHASQRVDLDRSGAASTHTRLHSSLARRNCQAQALKLRKAREICSSLCPRIRNCEVSAAVLGVSIGPKQP